MRSYTLLAPAKINLYLEIFGDRPDGFHELVMILQSIELADQLEIRANGTEQIRLFCDHADVPLDDTNLTYRAAKLMMAQFPSVYANYGGIDITLDKRIPVAAGLAGGSTDAAAVLVGMNLLWRLGLTKPELQRLAAQLGSDVPFCIAGGTAIATGRGELLDPIQDLNNLWVVLAKYRNIAVSTPWAYGTYRQQFGDTYLQEAREMQSRTSAIHAGPLVSAIAHQDGKQIGQLLYNDLEKVVLPEYKAVAKLRSVLAQAGGLGTMMSGSGPTVFTLCESQAEAERIRQQAETELNDPHLGFWVTRLTNKGIQVSA
ncbi:MAG: 4-(cytidine 5'-diphospho)-2-C-methyl-D-erythritol kinase [Snowella sp.]|nr:4-(cytidine 5'-diphospho)-2-C-methyl-D-erythritol kinase [Snowella sp.]